MKTDSGRSAHRPSHLRCPAPDAGPPAVQGSFDVGIGISGSPRQSWMAPLRV